MKKESDLSYLFVAAGSILFMTIAIPILDAASSWVQNKFNYQNAKLQDKLNKETANDNEIEQNTNAIGFQAPQEIECEDGEE